MELKLDILELEKQHLEFYCELNDVKNKYFKNKNNRIEYENKKWFCK